MNENLVERHLIHLGCSCAGARGWTEWVEASSPEEAQRIAEAGATECPACGEVIAESEAARRARLAL